MLDVTGRRWIMAGAGEVTCPVYYAFWVEWWRDDSVARDWWTGYIQPTIQALQAERGVTYLS